MLREVNSPRWRRTIAGSASILAIVVASQASAQGAAQREGATSSEAEQSAEAEAAPVIVVTHGTEY